jgi:subfamily B ATP-binding cassette protein MsbA
MRSINNDDFSDWDALKYLLRRFAFRYAGIGVLLVGVSITAGFVMALHPLVLAPALNIMEKTPPAAATSCSSLTLNNLGPTLLQWIGVDGHDRQRLILVVAGLYVLVAALSALLNFMTYILAVCIRTAISRDMTCHLHDHLLQLPLSFFNKQKSGDVISRLTNDVSGTAFFLDSVPRGMIQSAATIILCTALLFRTHPTLALAAMGVGFAQFAITRLLARHIRRHTQQQNVIYGVLATYLQEVLLQIKTIKSLAAEPFERGRLRDISTQVRRQVLRLAFIRHFEDPLRLTANSCAIAIVVVLTFKALDQGRLSVAGFALFLAITQRTIEPISQLFTQLLAVQGMLGSAARILQFLRMEPSVVDGPGTAQPPREKVVLEDVTFAYDPGQPVIRNLSLTIRRGETIALVGSSGAGKSTIADLLLRFHDPTSGRITLDGLDIRTFTQASYRSLFGVVPQECMLFNTTVRDNIIHGRAFDPQRLERALNLACAMDFVSQLPQGLDTLVGDRGVRLSGGQRQRIAIARAVYAQPPILILDEATSALDSESERLVQIAIDNILHQVTAVVIAHRMSTILNADRILVLSAGAIVASGTHPQLLENDPTYQRLYQMHFASRHTPSPSAHDA